VLLFDSPATVSVTRLGQVLRFVSIRQWILRYHTGGKFL